MDSQALVRSSRTNRLRHHDEGMSQLCDGASAAAVSRQPKRRVQQRRPSARQKPSSRSAVNEAVLDSLAKPTPLMKKGRIVV
jgi:hypothetical protein